MNVFKIPELREEILKYCSYVDKANFYKTNKKMLSQLVGNERNKVFRKYILDQHLKFADVYWTNVLLCDEMLLYFKKIIGISHRIYKKLHRVIHILKDELRLHLNTCVCVQSKCCKLSIKCYYDSKINLIDNALYFSICLLPTNRLKKPYELSEFQKKVIINFIYMLVKFVKRLSILNDIPHLVKILTVFAWDTSPKTAEMVNAVYKKLCFNVDTWARIVDTDIIHS